MELSINLLTVQFCVESYYTRVHFCLKQNLLKEKKHLVIYVYFCFHDVYFFL